MAGQRFYASSDSFTWPNGAVGYRPGGPFDCLGPFAKVTNCPIHGSTLRRTAYATAYADTYFSVPARMQIAGKTIKGYLTTEDSGVVFRVLDSHKHLIPANSLVSQG